MVAPEKLEYTAEQGYKGAHFDHHYNWAKAIRDKGNVTEDALFGYRPQHRRYCATIVTSTIKLSIGILLT
jgi:hypothetical protein